MDVKYLGHASFQLHSPKATLITDPFDSKMVGLKFPSVDADIITISHDHGDHNAAAAVGGKPMVFNMAGEYEVKEVRIYGYPTFHDVKKGTERGDNIIYKIVMEEISFLHCGDLGHLLSDELIEEIGSVQVLFVPVGGVYTLTVEEAIKLTAQLESSIIIPMHYKTAKHDDKIFSGLSSVDEFVKKMGVEASHEKKLTIKAESLIEETKLIILED